MAEWGLERVLRGLDAASDDGSHAAARAVAAQVRALAEALVASDPGPAGIERASALLAEALDALAADQRGPFDHGDELANVGPGREFLETSPLIGRTNPIAPPMSLRVEGDMVIGEVRFASAYEGPPGHVHGGFIAAAFDEVLGMAQHLSGLTGMTGRLVVRYRSPTPLHQPLRLVGRLLEVNGRKISTTGTLHVGDRLCAEAEGLFIAVDFTAFAARVQAERED